MEKLIPKHNTDPGCLSSYFLDITLARDAAEWWDRLPSKDSLCEAFLNGYATSGPVRLPALHEVVADRNSAYQRALHAFAEKLGVAAPNVVPDLEAEHFGRPLYLQMAALLALHGERPTTAEGLTKALLNHEVRYWRCLLAPFGWAEPERLAAQLLALATLAGGVATPREARPYWEIATTGSLASADFSALFYTLAPLYPGRQGLQAVRPDLLGEALVAQALLRAEGASLLDAVLAPTASHAVHRHALTVLSRLSSQRLDLHEVLVEALARNAGQCLQHAAVVATETPGDLPRLVQMAFGRLPPGIKSQVAGLLSPLLQEESVQLAELNCMVSEYMVEKFRHKQSGKALSAAANAEYAERLANHAVALTRAGRYEAALEHARQAVEIYRRLAQTRPDRYESDYAMSLSNYAGHLGEVGQSEVGLEPARQALEINRRLAQQRPDRYEPDCAASLNNYANRLGDAGQSEEALEHARQALEINRHLAQTRPDRYEHAYAMSLNNYAIRLNEVGQCEAALEPARQAMEIYRRLAQTRPDRYEPNYAGSLHNFAIRLSEVGQSEAGLEQAVQSLAIYDRVAAHRPERFDYNVIQTTCSTQFLSWLSDRTARDCALPDPDAIPPTIHPHRRPELELYAAFVRGCLAVDGASRRDAFTFVQSAWRLSTGGGKTATRTYWLCAAAWCATHAPDGLEALDWQTQWQSFVTQRKGQVPWWMLEVARRLSFRWPP